MSTTLDIVENPGPERQLRVVDARTAKRLVGVVDPAVAGPVLAEAANAAGRSPIS
jgi:hypothetical protein